MGAERPRFAPGFLEGVERFNQRRYWDAHESWEQLWLCASPPMKQFLQGLIQLAAAYHHLQRGTRSAAVRLFDSALGKLAPLPPRYCGIDRDPLVRDVAADRADAATGSRAEARFPTLPPPDSSFFPAEEEW